MVEAAEIDWLMAEMQLAREFLQSALGPPSQFSANTNADTPNRSTRSIAAESFIPLSVMRDQSFDPKASDVQSRPAEDQNSQ
jgi:hypothetical protein